MCLIYSLWYSLSVHKTTPKKCLAPLILRNCCQTLHPNVYAHCTKCLHMAHKLIIQPARQRIHIYQVAVPLVIRSLSVARLDRLAGNQISWHWLFPRSGRQVKCRTHHRPRQDYLGWRSPTTITSAHWQNCIYVRVVCFSSSFRSCNYVAPIVAFSSLSFFTCMLDFW